MAKYLISTSETYRVDTEAEAKQLIEDARTSGQGQIVKSSSEYKCQKAKNEIVQDWYRVVITRSHDDEKEPVGNTTIHFSNGYDKEDSAF
jgi:hypothetical protein